ncbi:MAG TPA: lysylphosphatidylglycerol synthase transmembrane domain-containing protein [Solirubrobacter sp.]|nr:lysylphosphatidylglycerol synthase transmembrane domain-containing protein [Solirubrobacter sp.]
MSDAVDALEGALAGLVEAVSGVAPGWLVLGVALHLANQVARGRGWYAVVRTACGSEHTARRRDVLAAWVAGAGAGGIVSARGGDAVRILVLNRQMPGHKAVLAGTLVAETAGETALGAALLAVALAFGVGPSLGPSTTTVLSAVAGALALTGAVLIGRRHRRVRGFMGRVACGCSPLRSPRSYARHVLPWQVLSRVLRLASLFCFLAAFHLPATFAAILLVTFAQCGGRLVPFSPAAVGAGTAILAACFEPVTGTSVPASQLAAFFVGTSTVLTVVGTALALAICVRSAAQASANAGPSEGRVRLGRLMRMRAAIAPRP